MSSTSSTKNNGALVAVVGASPFVAIPARGVPRCRDLRSRQYGKLVLRIRNGQVLGSMAYIHDMHRTCPMAPLRLLLTSCSSAKRKEMR